MVDFNNGKITDPSDINQFDSLAHRIGLLGSYTAFTRATGMYPERDSGSLVAITYCALGLGEAGEVQGKVKKIWRDTDGKISEEVRKELLLELGDLLWYTVRMTDELGFTFEDIIERNVEKLVDRANRNKISGSGDNR
jgi:NTP pyrophosphatase (non-canonical NTP hydrolase)